MSLAFVFPGQGSQSVGMLDGFAQSREVQALLAQADAALGEPLSQLIATGPSEALALTVNTQPAMLVAGLACYRAWRAAGSFSVASPARHCSRHYPLQARTLLRAVRSASAASGRRSSTFTRTARSPRLPGS